MRSDLARNECCIFADPEQQRRAALAQEMDAAEVQAGQHRARAVDAERESEIVGDRSVDPSVVRPEPGSEDDRAESAQVEFAYRVVAERRGHRQLRNLNASGGQLLGQQSPEVGPSRVAERDGLAEVVGELGM